MKKTLNAFPYQIVNEFPYKKEFAEAIISVLNDKRTCHNCPIEYLYITTHDIVRYLPRHLNGNCVICSHFFGWNLENCPCFILGSSETGKQAWIKLEEFGYI